MATGAIILGSIAAAGTAYSVYQGRKAAKAQRRARGVQQAQRRAEEARARRSQIADARRRRARVVNAAAAGGLTQTSGFTGGLGNLQSQLGGNLGFMDRSSERSTMFENFQQSAANSQGRANIGSAVSSLSMQGAGMFSGGGGSPQPRQASSSSPLFDTPGPNPRG